MRRVHLAVQAAIVLTMVAFVTWPEFRPVHTQSVWRYAPAAALQAKATDAARFAGQNATGATSQAASADGPLTGLAGLARTSLNAPIPYARLILRDIRTGQRLAQTSANENGEFAFLNLDPNLYIVELLGPDGAVVGTSTMVMMTGRELLVTDVRVAAGAAAVKASLADTFAPIAPQAATAASDRGVTRTTATQVAQVSPR